VPYKKRWEPRAQCERFNATVHPPSSPSRSRGRHCQRRDAPPVPPLLHRLPWLTSSSSSPTVRHPHSLSLSSSYPRMIYLFYPKCKVMYPLDLPLDDLKSTTHSTHIAPSTRKQTILFHHRRRLGREPPHVRRMNAPLSLRMQMGRRWTARPASATAARIIRAICGRPHLAANFLWVTAAAHIILQSESNACRCVLVCAGNEKEMLAKSLT
jgi:hypothetical protein